MPTCTAPGAALFATGLLQPGPCVPPGAPNCLQTTSTGSFMVQGALVGLPPGEQAALHLPVVNALGAPLSTREVACPVAPASRRVGVWGRGERTGRFPAAWAGWWRYGSAVRRPPRRRR
jgi:hypothetical protein